MSARDLGQFVRQVREEKNLTQEQLGEAIGYSHAHVSKIERGSLAGLNLDLLQNLAAALGIPVEHLESLWRDQPLPRPLVPAPEPSREIPVYEVGTVSASSSAAGGRMVDHWEYVPLSQTRGRILRAAIVDGDCMEPDIKRGDTVLFDQNTQPRDGQVVVAVLLTEGPDERGKGVIKRFYRLNGKVKLEPNVGNPIIVPADQVKLEGVVIEVRRRYAS